MYLIRDEREKNRLNVIYYCNAEAAAAADAIKNASFVTKRHVPRPIGEKCTKLSRFAAKRFRQTGFGQR